MNPAALISQLTASALLIVAPAQPPAAAPQITLGTDFPIYHGHARSASGQYFLRIRVRPEVRSVSFKFQTAPPTAPGENTVTAIELQEWPAPAGKKPKILNAGHVIQTPAAERRPDEPQVWRVHRGTITFGLRTTETIWLLRLATLPVDAKGHPPRLGTSFRFEADADPITDREKELMAWREKIADPYAESEAVRARVALLTDREVKLYTGFDTRAYFLQYWGPTKIADVPRNPDGSFAQRTETHGLFVLGKPLPNGKYLHHNGVLVKH